MLHKTETHHSSYSSPRFLGNSVRTISLLTLIVNFQGKAFISFCTWCTSYSNSAEVKRVFYDQLESIKILNRIQRSMSNFLYLYYIVIVLTYVQMICHKDFLSFFFFLSYFFGTVFSTEVIFLSSEVSCSWSMAKIRIHQE